MEEERESLRGHPKDQKESASNYSEHQERSEVMIVRLSARWASFLHASGVGVRAHLDDILAAPAADQLVAALPDPDYHARALIEVGIIVDKGDGRHREAERW